MNELSIMFGGAIKTLGNGVFEAPLVLFGSPSETDMANDYFSDSTDFWTAMPTSVPFLYHHGLDETMGQRRLGGGTAEVSLKSGVNAGIWMRGQLNLADEFESAIYKMAEMKKLGTSSGAVNHLVTRESVKGATHVKSWPLYEASLTPFPAEPRSYGKVSSIKTALDGPSFKTLLKEISDQEISDQEMNRETQPENAPEVKSAQDGVIAALAVLPFSEYLAVMGAVTGEFKRRVSWVREQRATKQGRTFSADNAQAIHAACDGMQGHIDDLRELVTPMPEEDQSTEKNKAEDSSSAGKLAGRAYIQFQSAAIARGGTISF